MLAHEEEHVLEDLKERLERQNMDFETYLKLRSTDEETFMAEEIRPAAKSRLERSLIVDSIIESEKLKIDQEMLKQHINDVMLEIHYSGNAEEMQKQMGKDEFSRAISMESVNRTMNAQLMERLKMIATGQPIPDDEEQKQPEMVEEIDSINDSEDEEEEPQNAESDEETITDVESLETEADETPVEQEPEEKAED
jgi:FKBP-type peptidyl-prolyl cis-trans isomerase (trigger factor)